MKELATMIMEVALDTGYGFDFLCEIVEEQVADGEPYDKAVEFVTAVAHEHDF